MGIFEMIAKSPSSLNSGIGQRAYFFAVEPIPFFAVEFIVESRDKLRVNEVNKSIANIASIVVIDG